MKKTLKVLSGLALVAALTFGLYSTNDNEQKTEIATESVTTYGDPGGGPGV
jgi:hypothetical protein